MLFKNAIFEPDNVGGDPGGGSSHPSETAVRDDVIVFCNNELVFVAQRIWRRTDQSEQSFASRRDVRAMLDVLWRPETFCCRVVAFVEESIEGFEYDRLVLFGGCLWHVQLLGLCSDD